MSKRKVAIYDLDQTYRERFADYLMGHKAEEMEIAIFSQKDYFLDALDTEHYQLAVLGRGYDEVEKVVEGKKIPVLVLEEEWPGSGKNRKYQEYAAEKTAFPEEEVWHILKYQSTEEIVRQMYLLTDVRRRKEQILMGTPKAEIIGIFSPVKHEMQMMFSLLYAENLSKERKTLYVNFMEYSGFSRLFGTEKEYDLGDLVLQLRDGQLHQEECYRCIGEIENFSYLYPFQNPENLLEIGGEDIQRLLDAVIKNMGFESIVIDFGPQIKNFPEILELCTLVHCIGKNGYYFECQMEEFSDYLKRTMTESFFERFRIVDLPFQAKWIHGGGNLIEQLGWSEFGDFVREYMEGGCHENQG